MKCFTGTNSFDKPPKLGKFNIVRCDNCRRAYIRSNLDTTHHGHEFSEEKSLLL
jgi:hypothetical protein